MQNNNFNNNYNKYNFIQENIEDLQKIIFD